MIALDFQSVAQIVASRGLNTVIAGLLLARLSWGVLSRFSAGRSGTSSMTRFAVWFSTLLVIAGLPLLGRAGSSLGASSVRLPELTLSSAWAIGLFVTWAVIAGGLLIRLSFSLWHVYRLRRECREIDRGLLTSSARAALAEVLHQFPRIRRVKLLVSDDVRVPTALGFFCPAVVLPAWALRDLSADELRVIVLHELAHLRRWDDWTNLAQKFIKALFFFHPAVWWIDSRLALEREIACDDMVLEQTANAWTYAASLVSVAEKVVAEKMRMGRALALAQSALGRVREVSQRVAQILDPNRARTNRGWRPALAMIGTLAVITVGAVPHAPELISFQGKVQPAGASGVSSIPITAASLRWAGEGTRPYVDKGGNPPASLRTVARQSASPQWTGEDPSTSLRTGARRSTYVSGLSTTGKTSAEPVSSAGRAADRPMVIAAKATLRRSNRGPKVVVAMAKAFDHTQSAETLLVWHSSQFGESQSTVWTLTVWRVRTADGEQQTFQETIVMNSL